MLTAQIEDEIRNFLANTYLSGRAERLKRDDSLLGNIIDSAGAIELVVFVEQHFGVSVEDQDVVPENFDSIRNLATYVQKKLDGKT